MKICVTCGAAFEPAKANFVSCDACREKRRKQKTVGKENRDRLLKRCKGQCFQCPFPDCYVSGKLPKKYQNNYQMKGK